MQVVRFGAMLMLAASSLFVRAAAPGTPAPVTIIGYLRDSGCVHRFHEVVKPLPNGCLQACVRAGSPLVVLTKDEQVYHPIFAEMPDQDVRAKLLPYAGKLVRVKGHVYERGGSRSISVEQIEEVKE